MLSEESTKSWVYSFTMKSALQVLILSNAPKLILQKTIDFWVRMDFSILVIHNVYDEPCSIDKVRSANKINYIQFQGNVYERLLEAMKYLTQSYVVIVPDDELMIGASLELACNLLDSNKEVLSVGGHTVSIQKYGFLYKVDSIYENHLNYNNHSNETKKRLSYHFGTSEPIIRKADCYRVMRIELLECIAKIVQCMPESECVYLFEVIAEIVLTAKGKSLYTNQILWLRNWVRPASTSKEVRSNYFYQWIEKDLVNRIRLKSALRAFLPEINPLDIEFAIDLAYRNRKIAEMHEISRLERAPRDDIARKVVRYLRSFPWLLKHPNGIRLSPQLKEFVSENSTYAELMEGVRQIIWVSK